MVSLFRRCLQSTCGRRSVPPWANRSLRYPMLSASVTASALGSAVSRRSVVPSCSQSSTLPVTVNRCSPSRVSRESWCGPEIQKASWLPTWTASSVVSSMISLDASGSSLPGSSMRIVLHGVPSIRGCDASASQTSTTTRDENTLSATCTSAGGPSASGTTMGKPTVARAPSSVTRSPRAAPDSTAEGVEAGGVATTRISIAPMARRAATAVPASSRITPATASRRTRRRGHSARPGKAGRLADARSASSRAVTAGAIGGVGGYSRVEPSAVSDRSTSARVMWSPISGLQRIAGVAFGRQPVPEPVQGSGQARLHGPRADAQGPRRLGFRQLQEVPVRDDQSVVLLQSAERAEQRLLRFHLESRRFRGRSRVPGAAVRGRAEREAFPPPRRTKPVLRLVRDDPQDPRPERTPGTESLERVVRLHERVLGGVLRVRSASGDEERGSKREFPVPRYQLPVRLDIAILGQLDEPSFLQWTALHPVGHR